MSKIKAGDIFRPGQTLAVLGVVGFLMAILFVPSWIVNNAKLTGVKRLEIANAYRATIIQGLGGLFFFSTAYFTWRNLKVAEANLKATQDKQITDAKVAEANLKVAEEKQITERFAKAVEMLGHPDIHVRLGAIYALERISNDSDKDYWQIMEILTAYVREKSPYQYTGNSRQNLEDKPYVPIKIDVQAVLTVISRRKNYREGEVYSLDLSGTNLMGARFGEANLNNVNFRRANLSDAYLVGAKLEGANFYQANLKEANLKEANLSYADLGCAELSSTNLCGAKLIRAKLGGAILCYANLCKVDFSDAYLIGADLLEAHFHEAKNLTPTQVEKAINPKKAHYDPGFQEQLG